MTRIVPGLGVTILDNNLVPITKINISVASAVFLIAKESSPLLKGKIIIKEMKKINEEKKIVPISGETINYGNIVYFDLEVLPERYIKTKIDEINLNFYEVKIINDENTQYGISVKAFGEAEGILLKDSKLIVEESEISLNLENFNIVLGDSNNTYRDGVYIRIKTKLLER